MHPQLTFAKQRVCKSLKNVLVLVSNYMQSSSFNFCLHNKVVELGESCLGCLKFFSGVSGEQNEVLLEVNKESAGF